MIIEDEHIKEAEKLLIGSAEFDNVERIPFIKRLDSCDLLAVPGSGKTTALLAKLYCISKHLPFPDGSGVLVLSHTNAAVNEVERNLKHSCPKLFEYPNFIGTVQSFVNDFLTKPYYTNKNNQKIAVIDTIIYIESLRRIVLNTFAAINETKQLFRTPNIGWIYRFKIKKKVDNTCQLIDMANNEEIIISKPRKNAKNYQDWTGEKKENIKHNLIKLKSDLLKSGIMSYEDSYFYANTYIDKFPEIKELLQKRFRYVFIDEMQDLELFQIDLIDKIFNNGEGKITIQRIGDINQAIYNSGKKVKVGADWIPRNQIYLKNSNRLTNEIATVVNYFTLDRQNDENGQSRFVVKGLRDIGNTIKPHLILFNQQSCKLLESKFKELIKNNSLIETTEAKKYGFKIIGWNAKWDDDEDRNGRLRLENIFECYKKEPAEKKETFDTLSRYLQYFDHDKKTLKELRKVILNILVFILRLENKTFKAKVRGQEFDRHYRESELIRLIQNRDDDTSNIFKTYLYTWAFSLMTKNNYSEIYEAIKNFITTEFKEWFDLEISQSTKNFIGNQFEQITINQPAPVEVEQDDDIKVEIGTVHSAKGQTHCATMYVETSYHAYETEKLAVVLKQATKNKSEILLPNPLLCNEHAYRSDKDKRAKETLKMMYVGFSRPTHLLCFAALKNNVENNIDGYKSAGWEVVDLTGPPPEDVIKEDMLKP